MGEKTGTFTNIDRTVHVSHQAVEPPGGARSDLDVFLDFARRMDFRDRDDKPLVKWRDAAGAFKAWARHSKGWFCDYSGLSYEKLSAGTGVQWPCNARYPDGTERIYTDLTFKTAAGECESFGRDLDTGTPIAPDHYKANDPRGRAVLKAADYRPPLEEPDKEYPFFLTTGRVVYHFHTRTKTGRCPDLNAAAPEPFVEMCAEDADRLKWSDGDAAEVSSRRGTLRLPVRVGDILPGHVFVPFHYGYSAGTFRAFRASWNILLFSGTTTLSSLTRVRNAGGVFAVACVSFVNSVTSLASGSRPTGRETV